jgi:hypothetical protein
VLQVSSEEVKVEAVGANSNPMAKFFSPKKEEDVEKPLEDRKVPEEEESDIKKVQELQEPE